MGKRIEVSKNVCVYEQVQANRQTIGVDSTQFISSEIAEAIGLVFKERLRQKEKWGEQNHEFPLWNSILSEEIGEANKSFLEEKHDDLLKESIEVAAVALQIVESLMRKK